MTAQDVLDNGHSGELAGPMGMVIACRCGAAWETRWEDGKRIYLPVNRLARERCARKSGNLLYPEKERKNESNR